MKEETSLNQASLPKVFEHYIAHFAGGSTHTQRAKENDLLHFITFLRRFSGVSAADKLKLKHWDYSSTYQFLEDCLAHGEAPATVSRRLATLKHAGRSLSERIAGFVNPTKEVKAPKVPTQRPKALDDSALKNVRKKVKERISEKPNFLRLRNLTIFELLLDTGLRADEVRNLRMAQIDRDLTWIKNVRTKARQFRNVYITSALRPTLKKYLEERDKELKRYFAVIPKNIGDTLPLFISGYRADLTEPDSFLMGAKSIWRAMREFSTDTKLHPHLLRHSFATDLLDTTKDIRLVAQALGHSDVRITMRYTERSQEEVAKALEESRKRSRKTTES